MDAWLHCRASTEGSWRVQHMNGLGGKKTASCCPLLLQGWPDCGRCEGGVGGHAQHQVALNRPSFECGGLVDSWPEPVQAFVRDVRARLAAPPGARLHDSYGKDAVDFPTMLRFNYWMQTELEALRTRRIRLMPIFGVQHAHVRLDLRTLVNLFRHTFPDDPAVKELAKWNKDAGACRNPYLFLLPERPPAKKKSCCKSPEEWEEHTLRLQAYEEAVAAAKATDGYLAQKERHEAYVAAKRAVAASFFKRLPTKKGWAFD